MYSKKMNSAVQNAQTLIDICSAKNNILLVTTEHLYRLADLITKLDPNAIDFDNLGLLNKPRITKYWNRFFEHYNELKQLSDKISSSKKILRNTITTLNHDKQGFDVVYAEFKQFGNPDDVEYLQQLMVTDNVASLLSNITAEYETLYSRVETVEVILMTTLETAILLAKQTTNRNSVDYPKLAVHQVSSFQYKQDYDRLKGMFS